ncbi:uncharacterized protein LOC122794911 [Protopterus annectens]|uniref:uncharacterized protein LOC122794911 n=1 Tax=Protopterus annectens TaxID=7888 RepID=UPI001CFA947C|nr:uncharacterized protein LOC122794911 [Protopterus annectens]
MSRLVRLAMHPVSRKEGHARFYTIGRIVKNICGMNLALKRYIGKSRVISWAVFHLNVQADLKNDLSFSIGSFIRNKTKKEFGKLESLLSVCVTERSPEDLSQIQMMIRRNKAFQNLPDNIQTQLCKAAIYQQYEEKSIVIKQSHPPTGCYFILSGSLVVAGSNMCTEAEYHKADFLNRVDEGDLFGIGVSQSEYSDLGSQFFIQWFQMAEERIAKFPLGEWSHRCALVGFSPSF